MQGKVLSRISIAGARVDGLATVLAVLALRRGSGGLAKFVLVFLALVNRVQGFEDALSTNQRLQVLDFDVAAILLDSLFEQLGAVRVFTQLCQHVLQLLRVLLAVSSETKQVQRLLVRHEATLDPQTRIGHLRSAFVGESLLLVVLLIQVVHAAFQAFLPSDAPDELIGVGFAVEVLNVVVCELV